MSQEIKTSRRHHIHHSEARSAAQSIARVKHFSCLERHNTVCSSESKAATLHSSHRQTCSSVGGSTLASTDSVRIFRLRAMTALLTHCFAPKNFSGHVHSYCAQLDHGIVPANTASCTAANFQLTFHDPAVFNGLLCLFQKSKSKATCFLESMNPQHFVVT